MIRSINKNYFVAIIFCGILLTTRGASAHAERALAQTITPFLYPPYPGTASQESIFDHSTPNYTFDHRVLAFTGDVANKNCPSPPPPGTPPPQPGVCNAGSGGYWSYSLGDWMFYDGHDGVDYGIAYRPVYAAADADQIVYAGWWDPQNHKINLGIYVRLHHSNGYSTYYGHMSSVSVQACSSPGCTFVPHGEMLGISGTTGNSTGPHLHFTVRNPAGKSVDPYGWKGTGADPWINNQRESLWIAYPSFVYSGAKIYPSGPALNFPPAPAIGFIVDDGSLGFDETPDECWNDIAHGSAQGGVMRYSRPRTTAPTCTAQWNFPQNSSVGVYSVYVRIPATRATSEGAVYTVHHAGRSDQVVVNQAVFPNIYYVTDGWVYIGRYNFNSAGGEYIELTNRTQDEPATISDLFVGADAVRFVFQGNTTPTPPTPVTVTPTITPSITRTPTITVTPSQTPTPTISRTPTATTTPSRTPTPTVTRTLTPSRTPTVTRTPTITRTPTAPVTPSRTRTPTFTVTPSRTRTPTATATPSRTRTATRTPTATRTSTATVTPSSTRTPTLTITPSRTRTPTATATPSRTRTHTRTPTITHTPTLTRTRPPTTTPSFKLIDVYFVKRARYNANMPPFEVKGTRWARSNMLPQAALNEYFKGPGATERFSLGWIAIYNGFTGYSRFELRDGVAHVFLTGVCAPNGRDFNIADLINLNLKQFPEIRFVKIYDQNGQTQNPNGLSDSVPFCLSEFFTPSPTITLTPTPTRTPTRTPTPTHTRRPAATLSFVKVNLYFVNRARYNANTPPFEVAGVRWVRTNNVIGNVLDEYFKGPGATERFTFGWIALYNGFTGYSRLEIRDGVAHVFLEGTCTPDERDFNIVDLIMLNLKQFPEVRFVKIYDENGITQDPNGLSDSIPACLQP